MKNSQNGQTIIEAVVALVTILLIVTAIAIVIVNGLYNSAFIKNQNEANKYAQQGMELVRNIHKNDLTAFRDLFINSAVVHCIDATTSSIYNSGCTDTVVNVGGFYNRTISFSPGGTICESTNTLTSAVKVTVKVKWSSSKCPQNNTFCHKSELASCMSYVYPASNP